MCVRLTSVRTSVVLHGTSKPVDHLGKFHIKTELSQRTDLLFSFQNYLGRNLEIFSGLWENVGVGTIIF